MPEAETYYKKALEMDSLNSCSPITSFDLYINASEFFFVTKRNEKALTLALLAEDQARHLDNPLFIGFALKSQAQALNELHKYDEAHKKASKALSLNHDTEDLRLLQGIHQNLAKSHASNQRWQQAYLEMTTYSEMTDSINVRKYRNDVRILTLQFEKEQREQELQAEAELEREKQKNLLRIMIFGFSLVFVTGTLFYFYQHQRQIRMLLQAELEKEDVIKALEKSEEDNYMKIKDIENKEAKIQNLETQLAAKNIVIDDQGFYDILNEKYNLSATDIETITAIGRKLKEKEMATRWDVRLISVKKRKQRLYKKLKKHFDVSEFSQYDAYDLYITEYHNFLEGKDNKEYL